MSIVILIIYTWRIKYQIIHISDLAKCTPNHQLVFAKTHKTGGSTFQNILFRHCLRNNQSIAFPIPKTWMFGFKQPFNASQVNGYSKTSGIEEKAGAFDVFLFHSIWNYNDVRKVVPNGPAITLLRDPVALFESGYVYFNNKPKVI